jgi:hypothetical protein
LFLPNKENKPKIIGKNVAVKLNVPCALFWGLTFSSDTNFRSERCASFGVRFGRLLLSNNKTTCLYLKWEFTRIILALLCGLFCEGISEKGYERLRCYKICFGNKMPV